MLEVSEIFKSYQGQSLLKGISFSVGAGETVCLLGPSGSGKSTLLRLIAGLEEPESGAIRWQGTDLLAVPAHRRDFGLVFQDYALFPHLNVFENVAFGLRMRRLAPERINMEVEASLDLVHLAGFGWRSVVDLSGGEQQRVALARALAPHPRLLMFDEPLGALDRNLRAGLMDELRGILHATGVPALYVTHDQEEAFSLADRILLLHGGGIVRSGTPQEVWDEPGSAWAARFLDAGNLLDGQVLPDGRAATSLGELPLECSHAHRIGDRVTLLIRPGGLAPTMNGGEAVCVQGLVSDIVFHQDRYKVTLDKGVYFYLPAPARLGESITVRLATSAIQCLG